MWSHFNKHEIEKISYNNFKNQKKKKKKMVYIDLLYNSLTAKFGVNLLDATVSEKVCFTDDRLTPTASHQRRKKWEVCASQLGAWH